MRFVKVGFPIIIRSAMTRSLARMRLISQLLSVNMCVIIFYGLHPTKEKRSGTCIIMHCQTWFPV
jgi:hypothetical protein